MHGMNILISIYCLIFMKQALGLTVCPQRNESSRQVLTKSYADKRYTSYSIKIGKVGSLVHCYQKCLAECLCYFANYKATSSGFDVCELVKYASCGLKSGVILQDASGWIATKFGRVSQFLVHELFYEYDTYGSVEIKNLWHQISKAI